MSTSNTVSVQVPATATTTHAAVKPKSVLIVGGGPCGIVTLRNLVERGDFERVEMYERRDDVGGVWYFDRPLLHSQSSNSPTSTSHTAPSTAQAPRWPSPAYDGLIGNVLPEFLAFSGEPFPEPPSVPHQPFPTLVETHAYLRKVAEPYLQNANANPGLPTGGAGVHESVGNQNGNEKDKNKAKGKIRLGREVVSVIELPLDGGEKKGWEVTTRDWLRGGGSEVKEVWDAVVVAVGWYDHPVWPETKGLDVLRKRGLAHHAKWWRGPFGFEGKKVMVVGNANSSNDIAAQLAPVVDGPVFQSIRRTAFPGFPSLPDERIKMVAPVSEFVLKARTASDQDEDDGLKFDARLQDGRVIEDLDVVHFGTGYRPLPDFVRVLNREGSRSIPTSSGPDNSSEKETKTDLVPLATPDTLPARVPNLHRLVLYAHNPTLAFVGAPMVYTPFTVADIVSTWLALAWTGLVSYPPTSEGRLVWEQERLESIERMYGPNSSTVGVDPGNRSAFMTYSVMGPDEQAYAAAFREDIVNVRPELDEVLPRWNDERTEVREAMFKTKFEALVYARDGNGSK